MMKKSTIVFFLVGLAAAFSAVSCNGENSNKAGLAVARMAVTTAAQPAVYTLDADFEKGNSVNVVHDPNHDQLQLDDTTEAFNFIWVSVSSKGTVVKFNTETGEILGEYWTSPSGEPKDPSRTTVDHNGNVWATNRAGNSVVRIGLIENGQCIDRNGNGVIDTSTGLNDIKPWDNSGGADTNGGVSSAQDECIVNYVRVSSSGTRHVSVDANNDVWVSGTGNRIFNLIDGLTGIIKRTEGPVGYGGYGGLIDGNGVIWSSNPLLRWDTSKPLTGTNGGNWTGWNHDSYGLCIDPDGNVWNTSLSNNTIRKFSPSGELLGTYNHGAYYSQGCVIDRNRHVWVASSLYDSTVGHLKPDGSLVGTISVGSGPTGVAVDGSGKIWATNYSSRNVARIDPGKGPLGPDGVTHVGEVDFTSEDLGGNLYNYSDMTGSTLHGAPNNGSWIVVHDSQIDNAEWGTLAWNAQTLGDSAIEVAVSSSNDGVTFGPEKQAENGVNIDVEDGRYLKVRVSFKRGSGNENPVLYDLTIYTRCGNGRVDDGEECDDGNAADGDGCSSTCLNENEPPVCSGARASSGVLSPPNHKFVDLSIDGVTDPDGDSVVVTVTAIRQDEPLNNQGDGDTCPDGSGIGSSIASVRAERSGTKKVPGDGRVYHVTFTASDNKGGECSGTVTVCVPHDRGNSSVCVDQGPLYDSTKCQ